MSKVVRSTAKSGSRSGTLCGLGASSLGPSYPPLPLANVVEVRVAKSRPDSASFNVRSVKINAPLSAPLSTKPVTLDFALIVADVGRGL